jgi:hypothetical protein
LHWHSPWRSGLSCCCSMNLSRPLILSPDNSSYPHSLLPSPEKIYQSSCHLIRFMTSNKFATTSFSFPIRKRRYAMT